jgi:hypothetical protein
MKVNLFLHHMKSIAAAISMSIALSSLCLAQGDSNWSAPAGSYTPTFGILDDASTSNGSPYTTCHTAWNANSTASGCWYVYSLNSDGSAHACSDSSSNPGKPSNPRCTIPGNTLIANPGQYIEIHGKHATAYSATASQISAHGSCPTTTNGQCDWVANTKGPVWIRSQDGTTNRATMTKALKVYGKYVIIENLTFDFTGTAPGGASMLLPSTSAGNSNPSDCSTTYDNRNCIDHIVFRHNVIDGDTNGSDHIASDVCIASIAIGGNPSTRSTLGDFQANAAIQEIGLWDNTIQHLRKTTSGDIDHGKDLSCSFASVNASGADSANHINVTKNIWFYDNVVDGVAQDFVQIGGARSDNRSLELIEGVYVGRNNLQHCVKSCVGVKSSHDVVISQNTIHDTFETSSASGNPSPAKCAIFQYGPRNVWFVNNECYNQTVGLYAASNTNPAIKIHQVVRSNATGKVTATLCEDLHGYSLSGYTVNIAGISDASFNGTGFSIDQGASSGLTLVWNQSGADATVTGTDSTCNTNNIGTATVFAGSTNNHDFYVYGNLFHDIYWRSPGYYNGPASPSSNGAMGAVISGTTWPDYLVVENNTAYRNNAFINIAGTVGAIHGVFKNNLVFWIYTDANQTKGYLTNIQDGNAVITQDHDLYCPSANVICATSDTGSLGFKFGSTTRSSLSAYQSAGGCTGCLGSDPSFVNPGSDFSLQSSSPARDSGTTPTSTSAFSSAFPSNVSIDIDRNGTSRPQNSTWDIGAYEY